ncbi:MAG: GTP cyclohydrolase II [Crocinitomicaceae bacterium]|nr:GTP cyclohydrolase II [Crocinitomicaceae bacterium]
MESSELHSLVSSRLPTVFGEFRISAYDSGRPELPHLFLTNIKTGSENAVVNVRIHSECMTGDVFGSTRCDCGEQLAASMKYIEEHGGVLIYLRQEGRGIGLVNKLKAYNLQDEGMDTIRANHALGFHSDDRKYKMAVAILNSAGIRRINLLTNNPDKLDVFRETEIEIVDRIPLMIQPRPENRHYLLTKKEAMGHLLHQL